MIVTGEGDLNKVGTQPAESRELNAILRIDTFQEAQVSRVGQDGAGDDLIIRLEDAYIVCGVSLLPDKMHLPLSVNGNIGGAHCRGEACSFPLPGSKRYTVIILYIVLDKPTFNTVVCQHTLYHCIIGYDGDDD